MDESSHQTNAINVNIGSGKCQANSNILYFNVCSLLPKLDDLRIICSLYSPDIVCITESWLDGSIENSEIFIQDYIAHHLDRNRHGGVLLIYVKDLFSSTVVYRGMPDFELIIVSVKSLGSNSPDLSIALFYRPPSSSYFILDTLFTTLCSVFISLSSLNG